MSEIPQIKSSPLKDQKEKEEFYGIQHLLQNEKFQEIAQAIADGIMETIGDENEVLKGIYRVQIGLYRNFSNAQYVLNRAVADGYEGNIVYKDPYYAVQIGEYNTLDEAVRLENELKKKGYDTLVIKE